MMNTNRFIKSLFISFLVASPLWVQAQEEYGTNDGDISDAEVVIQKDRQLALPLANRYFDKMDKTVRERSDKPISYDLKLLNYDLPEMNPPINPARIHHQKAENLYGNYLKAGFGNYITPYLEGFFNSRQNDRMDYGVRFKHLSSGEGAVYKDLSASSLNQLDLFGTVYQGSDKISAYIGHTRRVVHYYGFDEPVEEVNKDDIRKMTNLLTFGGAYNIVRSRNDFEVTPRLDGYIFSDNFDATEYNFELSATGKYKLNKDNSLSLDVGAVLNQAKQSLTENEQSVELKNSRNILYVSPSFNGKADAFTYSVGVRFAYSSDSTELDKNIYIYPNLHAYYNIDEGKLGAFVDIEGNLERVTLRSLNEENPYIGQLQQLVHADKLVDLTAGFDFIPISNVSVRGSAGYALIKNLGFFVNNWEDVSRFDVVYNDETTGNFHIGLEGSARFRELTASLSSQLNAYSVSDELQEPWHRPTMINKLSVNYQYLEKLTLGTNLIHYGGIKAKAFEPDEFGIVQETTTKLKPIFDLSLHADYSITDHLGAFLQLQNLFGQNYERYLNYKARGIQFMAGASYSF
ncbi:hypothetical protein V6R21_08425 [Limibacter armeniacum]|uniref:hypothetical protein n=1 Tax=Limibacter armeniacum TaxID=466084 RepID=UPI002FE522D4